ncbi:MAG: hypothetical protein EHM38_02090 [Geobacteraceae bacterium]|nr:MAG: hypothetical protein EHM38_02090 [Geobacteraceae bacterium]
MAGGVRSKPVTLVSADTPGLEILVGQPVRLRPIPVGCISFGIQEGSAVTPLEINHYPDVPHDV